MTELMRIRDDIELDLGTEFLIADVPSSLGPLLAESACESTQSGVHTSAFDELLAEIIVAYEAGDTSMDAAMAVRLYQALPLSRRQASSRRLWWWLGVVHAPDFVAHRWGKNSKTGQRNPARFTGDRVRQAYARLWWAVELTRDEQDYSLTESLLQLPGFQDIYEAVFGRAFGNYRPAMGAFVSSIAGKKEKVIREVAKELGYVLSSSLLESMNEDEISSLVQGIANDVEAKPRS